MKVIRTYKGCIGEPDAVASEAHARIMCEKFKRFAMREKLMKQAEEHKRVANYFCARAYDRALDMGTARGLRAFRATQPLRRLVAHEERYYVHADALPDAVKRLGQERRSCIYDKRRMQHAWK